MFHLLFRGVFERPGDISKAYGGGRIITKEEMRKMDEDFERREAEGKKKMQTFISAAVQKETENDKKIKKAINDGRGYMMFGNRKAAVQVLEDIREYISFQTELGGEAYLELAMALETVDRTGNRVTAIFCFIF